MSLPESHPFESGKQKVIPAVLVYVQRGDHYLMIHRNSKGQVGSGRADYHEGKWNGLGGKLELSESPLQAAVRELKEESGLDLAPSQFTSLGVIQFPNFKAHKNEDWMVFVFVAKLDESKKHEVLKRCEEGELHWIPRADLTSLNLWPGDRYFIPYVQQGRPFLGTIWYDGPVVKNYWIEPFRIRESSLN